MCQCNMVHYMAYCETGLSPVDFAGLFLVIPKREGKSRWLFFVNNEMNI